MLKQMLDRAEKSEERLRHRVESLETLCEQQLDQITGMKEMIGLKGAVLEILASMEILQDKFTYEIGLVHEEVKEQRGGRKRLWEPDQ